MGKNKKNQRKKINDIEIGFQSLEKRLEKMEQRGDFKDENGESGLGAEEREMTLLEFCNTLPKDHMINKELQVLKDAIDSLLGWIDRNAEWGIESEEDVELQVGEALRVIDGLTP